MVSIATQPSHAAPPRRRVSRSRAIGVTFAAGFRFGVGSPGASAGWRVVRKRAA